MMLTGYNPAGNDPSQGAKENYTSSNAEHSTNIGQGSFGMYENLGNYKRQQSYRATLHTRKSVVEVK